MSYNTLAEAQAVNAAIEQAHLDDATLYLDARYIWPGKIESTTQPENWPRVASDGLLIVDANGRDLVGVPDQVKKAEIVAAGIIAGGDSLLPVTVANASSASTQGRDIIEETVKSGDEAVTTRWSAATSETSTRSVQTLTDTGLPIVALIDAILKPVIDVATSASSTNFYFHRA